MLPSNNHFYVQEFLVNKFKFMHFITSFEIVFRYPWLFIKTQRIAFWMIAMILLSPLRNTRNY